MLSTLVLSNENRQLASRREEAPTSSGGGGCHLENLDLADNYNLSGLNISGCRNLRTLEVENTKIKSLNLSDCPYLKSLHIYGTYIGKISIRSNPCLQDAALYGEKNDQSSFGFTIYKSDQGELRLSGETPLVATINEANFPSEFFRKMIRDQRIDWDQDGVLSMAEARDVESLFPEDSEDAVTTLKGIEYFPNLTYLSSFNCRIEEVDLSRNTKLKILSVSGTEIKSLNVTKCPELIQLICSDIGLTKLDVSKNPKLYVLYCEGNKLTTLDISASASLRSAFAGKKTEQTNAKTGAKSRYYMSNENSSWILKVDPSTTVNTTAEKTGTWKKDSKGWWYRYSDGTYPKNCWAKIKGKWYHFDAAGYWQTGWKKIGGKWYFFSNGAMVTGTKTISGKTYHFDEEGVCLDS